MNRWHGLLTIQEIQHLNSKGDVLWQAKNLKNMLHVSGEEYILNLMFFGTAAPAIWYFGLDSRQTVEITDTMDTIAASGGEPNAVNTGYTRQGVSAITQFTLTKGSGSRATVVTTPLLTFASTDLQWGPVRNLFMATAVTSGTLISTVTLPDAVTVNQGEVLTVRMGMALRDAPTIV